MHVEFNKADSNTNISVPYARDVVVYSTFDVYSYQCGALFNVSYGS